MDHSHAFTGPYYVPSPLSPWIAKALVIQSMFCKAESSWQGKAYLQPNVS